MHVKPHHPLQELLGKLLFSIETVPPKEQRRMVNRACKEAAKWHEARIKRGLIMLEETWYKILCDKCNTVNWLFDGDPNDLTRPDIEGFICYQCKKSHSFSDEIELEMGIGDDHEKFDVGLKKPQFGG